MEILPCDLKNFAKLLRYTQKLHNFTEKPYPHNYLMAALLTSKNRSCFGVNNYTKTHTTTIQPEPAKYLITIHAEVDAIRNWGSKWSFSKNHHLKLYVIGFSRSGNFCLSSRPCNSCLQLISTFGISEIIYGRRDVNKFWIEKEEMR
jgi:cytidine deaminase